jgi:hypothetical protein
MNFISLAGKGEASGTRPGRSAKEQFENFVSRTDFQSADVRETPASLEEEMHK